MSTTDPANATGNTAVGSQVNRGVRPLSFDEWLEATRRRMHTGQWNDEECMHAAWDAAMEQVAAEFERRGEPNIGFYEPQEPAEIVRAMIRGEPAA